MMTDEPRTAIVTGAGKRVGEAIARHLLRHGWTVIAHVRKQGDAVPDGAHPVAAELTHADCAERIFAVADGLPPVRLLVNNAARFAHDGFGAYDIEEFESHMNANLRAPILLTEEFSARHRGGEDGLIVNLLDSKLAAPNPDFLSYTLSKQGLAGLTELSARALAGKGIRVNAIAPALMLKSPGQSDENFDRMHASNPLRRGVDPTHVVSALDYFIDNEVVTGQVLTLDSGQRFEPPGRDVQFAEEE